MSAAVNRPAVLVLIGLISVLVSLPVRAGDEPWVRYENQHFVGFSNAPEKKVLGLLEELETFRGAFLQVSTIVIPADAPKTQILIPASKKEFLALTGNKIFAGFAYHDGKRTLILMSAEGGRSETQALIRHEYAHALLRYRKFDYPRWYEEGFAELMSSTDLVNKGQSFTLGKPPDRAKQNGRPLYDWDQLVSDEFNPHTMTNRNVVSSAYAQAWLLAHYATLGNGQKNAPLLQNYFGRLQDGEAQGMAFQESFGVSASQLWDTQLKAYASKIPVYTLPYKPGVVDLAFAASPGAGAELDGIFKYLKAGLAFDDKTSPPQDVLASLPGRWAWIRIGMACEEYVQIALDPATKSITLTSPPSAGSKNPNSETFRYELAADGTVQLKTAEPADDDDGDAYSFKHHTTDLLCMGDGSVAATECTRRLYRCGS